MKSLHVLLCGLALGLPLVACDDSQAGLPTLALPDELALTANWLNQSISYVDLAALRDGADHDTAVVHTVELPDLAPGPLEIELTPDGSTAVVSISAGFFRIGIAGTLVNSGPIDASTGTLAFLDVDTGELLGTLDTGEDPTGITITPDGETALVAHFTSGNLAVVDIPTRSLVADVDVGIYAEEISLDDTGTVGLVGYSTDGSVRAFSVDDPEGSLSDQVKLDGDSAGIAFFPGTKVAFVVQAPNPLSPDSGYTVVDVGDPQQPEVLEDVRFGALFTGYPAVAAPKRKSVIVPVTTPDERLVVREYVLKKGKASLKQTVDVTDASLLSALGVNYDGDSTVVMTLARDRAVAVADLDSGDVQVVPWQQEEAGPADVVIR